MLVAMDVLPQLNAALVGRYLIERRIGQGGMATVYLARDVRHDRHVALKVLSPELAAVVGKERFLAEIRVTAKLQHPHLLPLFDSGEADGQVFYVMPYVAGESLRQRLEREKQLPIDDAVRIATAVGSALDYAHRHGVIHRDLKPENILLQEGQPLVADFGIALAVSNAGGNRITQTGISLGTPQYMSPEQATGDRQLDNRSDIYALGAVLYEMLTGEPPHSGTTAQAVIAKVLTDRPRAIRLSREMVPEHVEVATDRALAKVPADRWPSAHAFADALQGRGVAIPRGITTPGSLVSATRVGGLRGRLRDPVVLTLFALLVLATAAAARFAFRQREDPVLRLALVAPSAEIVMAGTSGRGVDISADGGTIVYNGALPTGMHAVFVRRLDELEVRPLAGTNLALDPAISPDGRWVAFLTGSTLSKVPTGGGPPILLGSASIQGATWVTNELIAAARQNAIWLFPANGQEPVALTAPDTTKGERFHSYPIASPDGRYVFYQSNRVGGSSTTLLGMAAVETRRSALLNVTGAAPIAVLDDALIYARLDGTIVGVHIDFENLRTVGDPVLLGEQVSVVAGGVGRAALSRSGTLVYQRGATVGQLSLIDTGGAQHTLLPEAKAYIGPRFSPEGRRVAVSIDSDIWIYDLTSATTTRLTTVGRNDRPEWTPDGQRVLFRSTREGVDDLWWQAADGSGAAERLLRLAGGPQEGVVTPDGRWLILRSVGHDTKRDIYYRALSGDTTLHPIATSEFEELMPRISADGKWIAYISDESGSSEVYVRAFPGPSGKVQVSIDGGSEPVWAPDGRTIYYRHSRELIAARVQATPRFSVVDRKRLFEGSYVPSAIHANFDVSPDGKRFLMINRAGTDAQVIVVYNWAKEARERLKGKVAGRN